MRQPSREATKVALFALLAFAPLGPVLAQGSGTAEAGAGGAQIPITVDNFVRAATDVELEKYVALGGGVNRFFHFREPTPIDSQPTIRMNRDTLYSTAVVDISEGATLTLPDVGDRYMSAMVVNQDHYINAVFDGGGAYDLDMETFGSPYVIVFVRSLVDASDPADVAEVNAIQDQMSVEAGSSEAFVVPEYDRDGLEQFVAAILALGPFLPDSRDMFGAREDVDPVRHLIGTAGGWGGLPETEALYLNVDPGLPTGAYRIEVPGDVPVDAFWSISLYNDRGFFEENDLGAYNINSVTGNRNDDGSMTVHLGDCEDGRVNCLPIMEGWNYTVRLYRPREDLREGRWSFPQVSAAE